MLFLVSLINLILWHFNLLGLPLSVTFCEPGCDNRNTNNMLLTDPWSLIGQIRMNRSNYLSLPGDSNVSNPRTAWRRPWCQSLQSLLSTIMLPSKVGLPVHTTTCSLTKHILKTCSWWHVMTPVPKGKVRGPQGTFLTVCLWLIKTIKPTGSLTVCGCVPEANRKPEQQDVLSQKTLLLLFNPTGRQLMETEFKLFTVFSE